MKKRNVKFGFKWPVIIFCVLFAFTFTVEASIKWSQPPLDNPESQHPECFWGWDEVSNYFIGPVVADDWLCEDELPVTDIHWWGSYEGWNNIEPPPNAPDLFHIGIWTDIPAGNPEPYSHPGTMIWEFIIPRMDTGEMNVGCDFHPDIGVVDACFEYNLFLDSADWFYQTPGPTVYWLSISAMYTEPPVEFAWGWKTREFFFNDAAIRIYDPMNPIVGSNYMFGEPIYDLGGLPFDMAFELTTIDIPPTETPTPDSTETPTPEPTSTPTELPDNIKWSQPPVFNPASQHSECYWGWDEVSLYGYVKIMADDWLCDQDTPVTDIHWWGSYIDWNQEVPPPNAPDLFHIGIWTDIPAGGTELFSHPGEMIWEYVIPRIETGEMHVGCDFHPDSGFLDTCFRYDLDLPIDNWFYQEPGPTIYWLSISAIYPTLPDENAWGWKSRPLNFNDNAIRMTNPLLPVIGSIYISGSPLEDLEGGPWDLAFELTTTEIQPTETPTQTPIPTNTSTPEFTATHTPNPTPTVTPTELPDNMKWSQPPVFNPLSPHSQCYWGWDQVSLYNYMPIAADDWLCEEDTPVTEIHWWGSYYGWDLPDPPPIPPDLFHIGIWTDVPAGGGEPFSHPGFMLWEYIVPRFEALEIPMGCDFHPDHPVIDTCFEYHVQLPIDAWFYQEPGPTIYWLSISAIYMGEPFEYLWGWKTRPLNFNDNAVRIFDPIAPIPGTAYVIGEPIFDTDMEPYDLAFQLFTTTIETPTPTSTSTPFIPTATPTSPVIPATTPMGMAFLILLVTGCLIGQIFIRR